MIEPLKDNTKAAIIGLTLLRVTVGFVMAAHGFQKLMGFEQWKQNVASMGIPFPDIAAPLAVAGELAGGLGLLVGLLTPLAAFGIACTMAVAILTVHIGNGLFAQNNGFEYPLTLLTVAVFYLLRGAGPVSVDAAVREFRKRRHTGEASSEHFARPRSEAHR